MMEIAIPLFAHPFRKFVGLAFFLVAEALWTLEVRAPVH